MNSNVYFQPVAGGILPAGIAQYQPSQFVRGCGAINTDGLGTWRIQLETAVPVTKRMLRWSPTGTTPVGGCSLQITEIDEFSFDLALNDLTGAVLNDVPWSFEVLTLPENK